MKRDKKSFLMIILLGLLLLTGCGVTSNPIEDQTVAQVPEGHIYLYGEMHGEKKILDKEFEIWKEYYTNQNMRHLYIEVPYYSAEFMNLWMHSDSDQILDEFYAELDGTAMHNTDVIQFYQKIKAECPETIFHGTDVGHQYDTTGKRFLEYLKAQSMEDSDAYEKTKEIIEQGQYYYQHSDNVYRENKMVENFMSTYDQMKSENIMGIYGGAHTGLEAMDTTQSIPCMANQLHGKYGDHISSEDLTVFAKATEPIKVETITVEGTAYKASYFGKEDLTGFKDYEFREFWRLEDAYNTFADRSKTGDYLPYNNYPMQMKKEQVFVIDYKMTDGTTVRKYYRSDGNDFEGMPTTEEFTLN